MVGLMTSSTPDTCGPKLSTMRYPIELMAQAAKLALQLAAGESESVQSCIYTPTLINRHRSFPCQAPDPSPPISPATGPSPASAPAQARLTPPSRVHRCVRAATALTAATALWRA